ncbi:hypothetical protein EPN52_05690 [bacterium]|nr:MAG: hypothetical protein EPN52_05690 [bacterium]
MKPMRGRERDDGASASYPRRNGLPVEDQGQQRRDLGQAQCISGVRAGPPLAAVVAIDDGD